MPKFDASRLAALIDPIYESAALPHLRRGLLAEFSDAVGAAGAFLHGDPTAGVKIICSESMDEVRDAGLRTGWLPHRNARMRRELNAFRQGHAVVTESMIFSPWELDHLPFNAEFVTPNKGRSFVAMRLAHEGPSSLVLSVQRYIGSEPFSTSEIETMRALLPHMQRAGQLAMRLRVARQEGLLDGLANFDCGALLLDRRGKVVRMNAKAEAIMAPGIAVRAGTLTALARDCDKALQKLIGSVIARGPLYQAEPIGAVPIARPGKPPLLVHGAPLARSAQDSIFQQARAVLMIVDPEAQLVPQAPVLRQVFGFTGAEASVAIAVSSGRDVDEIARMRGVTLGTLRNQLKTVFAKTGVRRQAELVALVLRYATVA
ncbi:MAG: helix-turn-helix transcriptional regulator [Beijerinckiaceae bacterium]|nr:helix-turn-helix transcriptional regulator [Beijerinckiaceae bacterium]